MSYAEIQPVEPEWLIPGWVQLGGVTYVAGDGGVGKSFLTADWASRVTHGAAWPVGDGIATVQPGSVILVSAEDDPNMSMAYRLRASGANLARVYDMTSDFTLPDGLDGLREDITEIGDVRLVVIDPLAAVSSIPLTSGNVRIRNKLSMPLERFARATGAATVVIHHTVKSGRTAGAKAITDAARNVLKITRSAQDERIRVISIDKTNVVDDRAGDIAYTLTGAGLDTHVEYLALPDAPTGATPREASTEDKILAVLAIAAPTPVATQEIATRAGLDYTACRVALTRAKQKDKVTSPTRGFWTVGASVNEAETSVPELIAA